MIKFSLRRKDIIMTIINKFLQKLSLRENNHGICMVFAAYVLSVFLLIIGSDALYDIKSKADAVQAQTDEANTLNVEYRMDYLQKYLPIRSQTAVVSKDTNWLLGFAMSSNEYSLMFEQMKDNKVLEETKAISSFSVAEAEPIVEEVEKILKRY